MDEQRSSHTAAADNAYLTAHSRASISATVGNPAIPPRRLVERAPQTVPAFRQFLGLAPRSHAYKNPASKQSPAPVVSTDGTVIGSQKVIVPSHSSAPPA